MVSKLFTSLPIVVVAALAGAPAMAADYVQAPGSTLIFACRYEGEAFSGRFPTFATRFSFDPNQLATAKLDVTIPLAGMTTANSDRDDTLKGDEFFDVEIGRAHV